MARYKHFMTNRNLWTPDFDPDHDPLKVMIIRDKLIDTARDDRPVKIKIYYPVDHNMKNLPVILWSHGLGGSVDGAAFLSRFLASHGFIMVHIQHHGTDSSLWEGKDGHPWDIIRATKIPRSATLNRYQDIPFVLEQLPTLFETHPEVGQMADLNNLGMSGHSFGALTTQVMAGMTFPGEDHQLHSFKHPAFKAGILYSPGSVEHLGDFDPADVYPSIDIPLMHMTGTDDGSPLSDLGYEIRLAVYDHTNKADKYLLILEDGDHMVFNGSRGKLGQNPNREKHERLIKIMALAFWEAKLKNNQDAKSWLTSEAESYLTDDAEYRFSNSSD